MELREARSQIETGEGASHRKRWRSLIGWSVESKLRRRRQTHDSDWRLSFENLAFDQRDTTIALCLLYDSASRVGLRGGPAFLYSEAGSGNWMGEHQAAARSDSGVK